MRQVDHLTKTEGAGVDDRHEVSRQTVGTMGRVPESRNERRGAELERRRVDRGVQDRTEKVFTSCASLGPDTIGATDEIGWDRRLDTMIQEIRFGAYVRELTVHQTRLSYNDLAPKVERDGQGKELPYRPRKVKLRPIDTYRLIQPYVSVRFMEQARAVVPLALYLMLFQILILNQSVLNSSIIAGGLVAVIIGLMLFMEGLKVGLMPLGETLGTRLPSKAPLPVVLIITFMLGISVTFAEPAIGALKTAGSIVDPTKAPYLYALLNQWSDSLVLVVGGAVGAAAVLGTLRFIYGWSLKPLIYLALIPCIGLTLYLSRDAELSKILGLAWDSGAVTTGPVTVPLVLSLGIGIASSAGKGSSSLSGFGIVTMASLFPVIGVMALAMVVAASTTPAEINRLGTAIGRQRGAGVVSANTRHRGGAWCARHRAPGDLPAPRHVRGPARTAAECRYHRLRHRVVRAGDDRVQPGPDLRIVPARRAVRQHGTGCVYRAAPRRGLAAV